MWLEYFSYCFLWKHDAKSNKVRTQTLFPLKLEREVPGSLLEAHSFLMTQENAAESEIAGMIYLWFIESREDFSHRLDPLEKDYTSYGTDLIIGVIVPVILKKRVQAPPPVISEYLLTDQPMCTRVHTHTLMHMRAHTHNMSKCVLKNAI